MSSMDLNLLPSSAKFQAKKINLKEKLNQLMLLIAGVWLVAGVGVFGFWLLGKSQLEREVIKHGVVSKEFAALASEIVIGQDLKTKAKLVGELLDKRFEYSRAFEQVSNIFPPGIELVDFDLDDKKSISLNGLTEDKKMMDQVEFMVEEINRGNNEDFLKASIGTVSLENNIWTFSMGVELK